MVKRLSAMQETWVQSLVGKIPWRRKCQPTPVFLPGKSHGPLSLVGYRPWGRKELDTTERLHFHFLFTNAGDITNVGLIPGLGRSLGGGHGNQLQYSFLENPMDRGIWWATVLRVAQSQTRLRQSSMHAWMDVWDERFPLCWLSLECGLRCSGCISRLGGDSVCCAVLSHSVGSSSL